MKNLCLIFFVSISIYLFGCSKKMPQTEAEVPSVKVKVAIDYVGNGGYYNDDIESIPSGLIVGTINGPYNVPLTNTYTIKYKADNNFKEITYQTNFGGGLVTYDTYIIHCYVNKNTEYIEVKHE